MAAQRVGVRASFRWLESPWSAGDGESMRSEAKVVVIGGGVAGCSLLYHLAKKGWSDVMLLEQDTLTSGSTWHAAGLCTQFISSWNLMGLLKYSVELYQSLEEETGQAVDYHACGSLRIGSSQDRVDEFHHRKGIADTLGVPFEILSPEKARQLFPLADFSDALADLWRFVAAANRYVDATQPFKLARDPDQAGRVDTILYNLAESLRLIALLLAPAAPATTTPGGIAAANAGDALAPPSRSSLVQRLSMRAARCSCTPRRSSPPGGCT